ncbi:hypothetical protein LI328DRAFT_158947 [Trichoderma asperelloides]|nr:hypothetical protein LI328DRAFT_158947 [Trichoderma asperelloides]
MTSSDLSFCARQAVIDAGASLLSSAHSETTGGRKLQQQKANAGMAPATRPRACSIRSNGKNRAARQGSRHVQ